MCLVSLDCTVVGVDTCKLDVFAKVIATILAKEAFTTGNTGLKGYTITLIILSALMIVQRPESTYQASGS